MKRFAAAFLAFNMVVTLCPATTHKTVKEVKAAALSTSRVSVYDPSIVKVNGKYYLFGSHMADAVSIDLTSWNTFTTNINYYYAKIFAKAGAWSAHGSSSYNISGNLWAPDVIYNKAMRKWCMYMSVNGDRQYSSIAMATSDSVTRPYTYVGTVVYSGFVNATQARETDYARVTGTNIQQWSYNGCESQKFKLVSNGAGYYYILTGALGYKSCLDIESGKSADDTNVIQWNYWGGLGQQWKLERAN